ncbi:esterase/lipase family protein [Streptomyces pinistramenti]|uniref:esterase/lipase family protein n=1 Tax=Streptomyces pinistramenti TaxID=2884812 RepID=UPI001D0740E4|nr:alpha/beta fold hydrolase [Streptomyces pinistramenti]MCB5907492.1 triacylglycerol lipase [Streptomyces pinistramenti]
MRRITVTALSALAAAVLAAGPAVAAPAPEAASHIPVIFVHGRNAGPGVWGDMTAYFEHHGYSQDRIFAWGYDSSQSTNEVLDGELASYVDEVLTKTGAQQVDLVAHSLGSLPTRWYVKFGGGQQKVAHWVSLAGPNHGTDLAWACAAWDQGCRDMTPGSYVVSHLNRDTETPGPVRYTTFWSACDEQITPAKSTPLSGATNVKTACLKHNDFLSNDEVILGVFATLTG